MHPRADRSQHLRIIEAILFAAEAPVAIEKLQAFFPEGTDVTALLADLQATTPTAASTSCRSLPLDAAHR